MRVLAVFMALFLAPGAAWGQCGGPFGAFVGGLRAEALAQGHPRARVQAFFAPVRHDPGVIRADRRQGVFQLPFTDFARRLISTHRLDNGRRKAGRHRALFDRIERRHGVSRGVLLAFWGFETDYGAGQGDFNTLNALVTLAHDCRRPELFRPQILAALELFARNDFDPATTTGAWAGEIGMVQMLPRDILNFGVDGDGDGQVDLKRSAADALMSGARMLAALGWRAGEPWLQEVAVPQNLDWSRTGLETVWPGADWARLGVTARHGQIRGDLPARLILPQGRNGPAFLAYPNFDVFLHWNQSLTYVLTAGYFANRLEGAPVFTPGRPAPGLSGTQMKALQRKLEARGYDVGGIDGILGAGTRAGVRAVQVKLGLPADAWPTQALLDRL